MAESCPGDKFREGVNAPSTHETINEGVIREKMFGLLLGEKGYLKEDIEEEVPFDLITEKDKVQVIQSLRLRKNIRKRSIHIIFFISFHKLYQLHLLLF